MKRRLKWSFGVYGGTGNNCRGAGKTAHSDRLKRPTLHTKPFTLKNKGSFFMLLQKLFYTLKMILNFKNIL